MNAAVLIPVTAAVQIHHYRSCLKNRRDVLISPSLWQYAVLFNRFSYPSELEKTLLLRGYHTVLQDALPHYPKSMKCYLSRTADRMPSERHQPGRLKTYYLLNAASLLPVLALEVKDGETVLDLCAAPGGKSIALLQCAYPDTLSPGSPSPSEQCLFGKPTIEESSSATILSSVFVTLNHNSYAGYLLCNEYDRLRGRWLRQTLESFIPQPLRNVIKVSELDGREVGDAQPATFDKVLVDAPCSNDRSWLFSSDSQKATYRICQRNNLPALQVGLLRSAIKALRPGGLLIYSTCTLSKAENQDVISEILTSDSNIVPMDISGIARTFSQDFTFAPTDQKCSLLVIPEKGKAWGPMYIAKLKKGMSTRKWQGELCKPC
ncbi:tRNA (cytosine(34)-C(5))-methyltransferase, mitochondrial isoform X2 [Rattus norvegicus]|uniref:tRNA (cytosine(34)-C(5))-methyltransferase, mitochondrial isoform X2 n=1 Tax=Rattus norvegicus TaxID=10116 RepID=UPI002FD82263